MQGKRGG